MNDYKLDPANYVSMPGTVWDAALERIGIELELISDHKILDIFERQKRGGIVFVGSQRNVEANNRYVEGYDNTKPGYYLMYLDANHLYGWEKCANLCHIKMLDFIMRIWKMF